MLHPLNSTLIHYLTRIGLLLVIIGGFDGVFGGEVRPVEAENVGHDYLVENWQSDEGLPRNTITALAQDAQGYLWLGTPFGVIRFDGLNFTAYEGEASLALSQGHVQGVYSGNDGMLWINTRRSGLIRQTNGVFTQVQQTNLSTHTAIDSLAQTADGKLWLTSGNGTVGFLQGENFYATASLSRVAQGPMLFNLVTDIKGGLWFSKQNTYGQLIDGQPTNYTKFPDSVIVLAPSHAGGLWLSNGRNLRRIPVGQTTNSEIIISLPFGIYGVKVLYEDHSGTLWVGTRNNGLFRLHDNELEPVGGINQPILALLEDAEGDLWVGTDGAGLFKIRPRAFRLITATDGLPAGPVFSVCGDWAAPSVNGLARILASGKVEMVADYERYGMAALQDDGASGLWLGTTSGRLIHQTGDGQRLPPVRLGNNNTQLRVLHRDAKGNIWIGGFPSGLFRLPASGEEKLKIFSESEFPNKPVTAIAEAANGVIWIGDAGGALHRYENGGFHQFGAESGFAGFPIGSLLPEADGGLWVGTLGGGLGRFDGRQIKFLNAGSGLGDNVISQLIEDRAGWLWVGTSHGIYRTRVSELQAVLAGRKKKSTVVHFGRADGLANIECVAEHQPSAWLTQEGWLRFATSKGILTFDPSAIPDNPLPPPLNLESVTVDGDLVARQNPIRLAHDYKKIEFRYTAMSFVAPEEVLFRRRLVGFDEDWVEDGTAREASYPRLPPGHYEFEFTACNNQGVWNDQPVRLPFEIMPAIWQTGWFRIGALVLFAVLVGGTTRYWTKARMRRKLERLEQAHSLERERTRISRDLHDDLGARLTQMAFLTDLAANGSETPAEMKAQLKDVSSQARHAVQSLDETVWLVNPQKDTLAHLIGYIASYAEQFFLRTSVHYRQEICPQPPEITLPADLRRDVYLLVKEALNNVLKHSGATEVWLRMTVRGPLLRIVVQDNGQGFSLPELKTHRLGLESMRKRAAAADIKLRLRSAPGEGTRLTLRLALARLAKRNGGIHPDTIFSERAEPKPQTP